MIKKIRNTIQKKKKKLRFKRWQIHQSMTKMKYQINKQVSDI